MYKIIEKKPLTENTDLMIIADPMLAQKAQPGQFIIIRKDETSERIPLTIADFDRQAGTVTVIFQKVGVSTRELGELQAGMAVRNFVGPLGKPSDIEKYGEVVMVAGGVGVAPVYPIARALHEAGNKVTVIVGARNEKLLFWEDKLRAAVDEMIICTDDGSKGIKAVVTQPLREILQNRPGIARVWAIGPSIMMKFCAAVVKEFNVPMLVSLDSIMVDGTGMCGACRVEVGGETKFVCVDGPEFEGTQVNWDIVLSRKKLFVSEEQESLRLYQNALHSDHVCHLDQELKKNEVEQTVQRVVA
jgi:ferredoxin--NADP+ reductase